MDSTRSRRRRLLVLLPGAIVAGLALGVGLSVVQAGGWEAWVSRRGVVPGYGEDGRAVPALGGRRLYLDCRGTGSPTVVLEAGMGMDARSWGAVFPMLAAETRTCVYSRANRWGSDPRGEHTVGDAVADLRAALAAAGEAPPFLLVGHSLGDVHARVFAGVHPAETAGLVLVDPFGPDQFRRLIGLAPPGLAARWQANLDGNIAAVEATERLAWPPSEAELAAVTLGDLPVETVAVPQPFATDPNIPDADRGRLEAAWYAEMATVSNRARVTLAPGSSHMIQWDRPNLVVDAVRRVRAVAGDGDE
jgi:pimeloyl-ACP methyl ester carboxylesterase